MKLEECYNWETQLKPNPDAETITTDNDIYFVVVVPLWSLIYLYNY